MQADAGVADLTTPPAKAAEEGLGQKIYQAQCMQCHGVNGRGGIPVSVVGFISEKERAFLKTKTFAASQQPWVFSQPVFVDLVSKGLPGRNMPGFADYSSEECSASYQYVLSLTNK